MQRGPITCLENVHLEMRALGKRNVKPSSRRNFRQVSMVRHAGAYELLRRVNRSRFCR